MRKNKKTKKHDQSIEIRFNKNHDISFDELINQYKILSIKLKNYATLVAMSEEEACR